MVITLNQSRIEKEKQMIVKMIDIYYKKKSHGTIEEGEELKAYAIKRLDNCRHGDDKGFCSHCKTQCYIPKYKAKIKEVMKYSGPRMMLYNPLMVINHLLLDIKKSSKSI